MIIDFEHLKDQVDTLHKRIYVLKDMYCGDDEKAMCVYICNSLENVYTCLKNLKDMARPIAKYAGGDTVWHVNDEDEICSFEVNRIASDQTGVSYEHDCIQPEWWLEEQLYPSREALIESQIKYWQSLKDESVTDCNQLECKHESDGYTYFKYGIDETLMEALKKRKPKLKCMQCEEYYE